MTKNQRKEEEIKHKGADNRFEVSWDFVFSAVPKARNHRWRNRAKGAANFTPIGSERSKETEMNVTRNTILRTKRKK